MQDKLTTWGDDKADCGKLKVTQVIVIVNTRPEYGLLQVQFDPSPS